MPTVNETAEYFVVGGALTDEHSCYVVRAVDREWRSVTRDRGLYCVFGPPGIGKSSLAVHAVAAVRREGGQAVYVSAASSCGDVRDFAAAIARQLGIDAAAARWWKAQAGPPDAARLAAFFRDVMLASSHGPVTVFVDDVELALEAPHGADVLGAVALCNLRRDGAAADQRLAFVILGTSSRRQIAARDAGSPFASATVAEPGDFSPEEAYRLSAGFGGARELTQALMDRIFAWTGGHPYLTQFVARGVARKGGRLEDVERVVREQLLAPASAAAEPLLARLREVLCARTPAARRASRLLRQAALGRKVVAPSDLRVLEVLHSSGAAIIEEDGRLAPRNRIVRELALAGWFERSRRAARIAAAAVVILMLGAAGAVWYTQYLPQSDVATLSSSDAELPAVASAYERLHSLPGFAARADELYRAALERLASETATLEEATGVDARLRAVTGGDSVADDLLAEFWLRRARAAANAEQRDAALLFALRAADLPSPRAAVAAAYAQELGGDDYPNLEGSLRLAAPPLAWRMLFEQGTLATIDAEQRLGLVPFSGGDTAADVPPRPMTALTHQAVRRELAVEGEGSAGEFELTLTLEHPVGGELLVTLAAPSGSQAVVVVPSSTSAALETFTFPATPGSALAALGDEARAGQWRLTVVDRSLDNVGTLAGWRLRFGAEAFVDAPPEPLPIPDPERTPVIERSLHDGYAIAWPRQPGAIGTAALWSLDSGRLVRDFALPAVPQTLAVNVTGEKFLAATDSVATLFDSATGNVAARAAADAGFTLPPVFSADGAYFAIAERVAEGPPLFSVLRAADGGLRSSFEGIADAVRWQLGPGARWIAVTRGDGSVGVLETGRGNVVAELAPERPIARLLAVGDEAALLSIDGDGELAVQAFANGAPPRRLGRTADPASVSVTADGRLVAFAQDGAAVVVALRTGSVVQRVRHAVGAAVLGTQLARDGSALVTFGTDMLRRWSLGPAAARAGAGARASEASAPLVALGRGGARAALGFDSGQLETVATDVVATAPSPLAYFGHRGPITAIAYAKRTDVVATGGNDGVVRLWNADSGEPLGTLLHVNDTPIARVALADDASVVAMVAERKLRVARVRDGRVVAEASLDERSAALAVAPDGATVAFATRVGEVVLVGAADGRMLWRREFPAGIASLAFGTAALAVGDRRGGVHWLSLTSGESVAEPLALPQPVQWLDWNDDSTLVLVATRDWVHAISGGGRLESRYSRLVMPPAGAFAAGAGTAFVAAVQDAVGTPRGLKFDLAAWPEPGANATAFLRRNWTAMLGFKIDAAGDVVPFVP